MSKSTVALIVAGIGVLCLPSWAMGDAAGDYQTLFGQEEKAVAAKKDAAASVEFARKLLNTAHSARGQNDLRALLCEKAYEFALKAPAGYVPAKDYQVAMGAMKLLIQTRPDKKNVAQEKLLKVYQLRYARSAADAAARGFRPSERDRKKCGLELMQFLIAFGEDKADTRQQAEAIALYRQALTLATTWRSARKAEIVETIKELSAAREAERRAGALRARLKNNPKDEVARRALIMAYLGTLDDPAEAVKLLTPDMDGDLGTFVPLAAKKVHDLDEPACIQLAEWLLAVAEKSPPADKSVLLRRARACCERYLELHMAQDAAFLKGQMLLEKTGGALITLCNGVTMKFVRIPAGKFLMGSPEEARSIREGPLHKVTISNAFYMGVYEVTQKQYEAVIGSNPTRFKGASNPVDSVTWLDAKAFCDRLSAKTGKTVCLPTEAQWEYACRAGSKTAYSFGNDASKLIDYAWYAQNSGRKTHHPVGQKKPNAFGLYDMQGNVWEWCSDWFASYKNAKTLDPMGPALGSNRVLRGGCCSYSPEGCRSAYRFNLEPLARSQLIGFRVVVDLPTGQTGLH